MPSPVSRTLTIPFSSSLVRVTVTRPPAGVNFSAFERMFLNTCCNRLTSAFTTTGWCFSMTCRTTCFCVARSKYASTADRITWPRSAVVRSKTTVPRASRVSSRRSSTSLVCNNALRSMTSAARSTRAGSLPIFNMRAHPRIGVSGVRSSCESTARNSSFAAAVALNSAAVSSYWRVRSVSRRSASPSTWSNSP